MVRRKTINVTGIERLEGIPYHDAWAAYTCVNCRKINYVRIGQKLLMPKKAVENCVWECEHCHFSHSKESELPFENWEDEYNASGSVTAIRFWEGFFRTATEHPESYANENKRDKWPSQFYTNNELIDLAKITGA